MWKASASEWMAEEARCCVIRIIADTRAKIVRSRATEQAEEKRQRAVQDASRRQGNGTRICNEADPFSHPDSLARFRGILDGPDCDLKAEE